MSRRRALRHRLAACCARLRPGTTAELASLVLRMSDEIDTRERMLDAALGAAGRGPDRVDVRGIRSTADRPRRAEAVNRLAS
jgi:hypothetical protein